MPLHRDTKSARDAFFGPEDFAARAGTASSGEVDIELPSHSHLGKAFPLATRRLLVYISGIVLCVLIVRLGVLQVWQGDLWRAYAENNRLRLEVIPSRRGQLYDRMGMELTEYTPTLALEADLRASSPQREDRMQQLRTLQKLGIALDEEAVTAFIDDAVPQSLVILADDLEIPRAINVMSHLDLLAGMRVVTHERRSLTDDASFAHVVGFVGKLSRSEWETHKESPLRYQWNDVMGKSGLESAYEEVLRGMPGRREIEVNVRGRGEEVIAEEIPRHGAPLHLTLDAGLQKIASHALLDSIRANDATGGAVVVLDPHTGEVLVLTSAPQFYANQFAQGDPDYVSRVLSDTAQPLFNRAISGQYPIGSAIKPMIAAAALQEGIVTPRTRIYSQGGLRVGDWFFPDWKAGGHGWVDVYQAIAESVNTYFYVVGGGSQEQEGLGIEKMTQYAHRFGLGAVTGINLAGEQSGFIPTPAWKETIKGESWYVGDTYHFAIGQGDVLVTPLQVARMTAVFANLGFLVTPRLNMAELPAPRVKIDQVSEGTLMQVNAAMRQTVLTGSARSLHALPITVAGKTGTAQAGGKKIAHAWFTGFVPFRDPEIVITVLIEHGGEGSVAAVPVAREIILWWNDNRR